MGTEYCHSIRIVVLQKHLVICWAIPRAPHETTYHLADWQGTFGEDLTSITSDPRLVSPTAGDFTLIADSPCINAGTTLTVTTDAGWNVTQISVGDAYPFCWGYNVQNGDKIIVGTEPATDIIAVDYISNTITVSDPITYPIGAGIRLYTADGQTDIGYAEYETPTPTPTATASPTPGSTPVPSA